MRQLFRSVASRASTWVGSPLVFFAACVAVVLWALTGQYFDYSDTWQLIINTGTTIITFLMVFLIQNTQNRDSKAVQLKLDELIRTTKGARNYYVGLEELTDDEIEQLNRQFHNIAHRPNAARAIKKLHETIEAEHTQRRKLHLPKKD
ncbi:hypothetical protein CR983_03330 [Candidatus Saccharibacteria bacterium]|nr:MAG: hypothetical protein CR983_03330 [Candidatus Saccharibacteria bacterium]